MTSGLFGFDKESSQMRATSMKRPPRLALEAPRRANARLALAGGVS